ncbi:hypothetical protein F2Q69_00048943 [Brassica cretica]|uniref:Uncharacterized protein n=1 Tax=Brassica cretica TaxID=69181 RepID=A0A8S9PT47_BRACR|nr:hypothetical protein F2Q69_00048943 [Brassica cretica]
MYSSCSILFVKSISNAFITATDKIEQPPCVAVDKRSNLDFVESLMLFTKWDDRINICTSD